MWRQDSYLIRRKYEPSLVVDRSKGEKTLNWYRLQDGGKKGSFNKQQNDGESKQNVSQYWPLEHTGPNFTALLTVSRASALMEAGNSVLTASIFHGLALLGILC